MRCNWKLPQTGRGTQNVNALVLKYSRFALTAIKASSFSFSFPSHLTSQCASGLSFPSLHFWQPRYLLLKSVRTFDFQLQGAVGSYLPSYFLLFAIAPLDEVEVEEEVTQRDPEFLVTAAFPESNPFGRTSIHTVYTTRVPTPLDVSAVLSISRCRQRREEPDVAKC